jgi:intracellular sulfur oxidation DsrE/DsrF family protein
MVLIDGSVAQHGSDCYNRRMIKSTVETLARRSFLSRFGIAVPLFGSTQAAATAPEGRYQATRHPQDDWFDQIPGKHRCFWDTTTTEELDRAMLFCTNYIEQSKESYGLESKELALIIGVRYQAAAFGFTHAMWEKYSVSLSNWAKFVDPKTSQPPTTNARQTQMNALAKLGVQFSICDRASHNISRSIARRVDGKADEIYAQLIANRVDNPHQVPAGIIALNRAQEHGYTSM